MSETSKNRQSMLHARGSRGTATAGCGARGEPTHAASQAAQHHSLAVSAHRESVSASCAVTPRSWRPVASQELTRDSSPFIASCKSHEAAHQPNAHVLMLRPHSLLGMHGVLRPAMLQICPCRSLIYLHATCSSRCQCIGPQCCSHLQAVQTSHLLSLQ
jgi:hypothetical protein